MALIGIGSTAARLQKLVEMLEKSMEWSGGSKAAVVWLPLGMKHAFLDWRFAHWLRYDE